MQFKIIERPVGDIFPAEYNPREISDAAFDGLKESIKKFGMPSPLVVNRRTGVLVSGHQRLKAATAVGWLTVPVVEVDLSPAEEKALNVTLNNRHIGGDFTAGLAEVLDEVRLELGDEFMKDLRLDDIEIPEFEIFDDGDAASDEPPMPPVYAKSKLGDLWTLGKHRVLCGDSTSIGDVDRLLDDKSVDITFTSPPYNAGRFGYDGGVDKYKGTSDDKSQDDYFDFLTSFTNIAVEKSHYVFFNNQFLSGNRHALAKFFGHYSGLVKDIFPWIKNTAPPNVNKGVFTNRFEFFLCLEKNNKKKGFPVEWQGKFHNIIEGHTASRDNVASDIHSATMPLYLPDWFFERLPFIKTVYDPFGGSGTTLIACETSNRTCFMMELDPKYVDVILTRWAKHTGKDPIRDDGVKWSELQKPDDPVYEV